MSSVHDQASSSGASASSAPAGAFDPLSEVLQTVRLTGALFFLWEVAPPFAFPAPAGKLLAPVLLPGAQQIVSYHVVVEGACWGGLLGRPALYLEAGDVLLIPRGDAYAIGDTEASCRSASLQTGPALERFRAMAAAERPFAVREGGDRPSARIVCGFLGCDVRPFNPVVSALPDAVRLRPDSGGAGALRALADYAVAEASAPGPGSRGVLIRVGELMFMEVVRRCLRQAERLPRGWLSGLVDPIAGSCLSLIHRRPGEAWTLGRLAREVGCSRSTLAQRFAERVGEPPMRYLARWRLALAAGLLQDDALSVAAIASRVGYGSGPAFSRAFQRAFGTSPSDWRRRD